MRTTTRSKILEYLKKQQTASVWDMSNALAMTGANIRHHLASLKSEGLVEIFSQSRDGRGRPENRYGISRRLRGDCLAELAAVLLDVWLGTTSESVLESGLRSVAVKMARAGSPDPRVSLTNRLIGMISRLNELHYQAGWEAGPDGPVVTFKHCPYETIVTSNPELCRVDAFILEQWTGLPAEQTARLQKNARGSTYCTFRVTGSRSDLPVEVVNYH